MTHLSVKAGQPALFEWPDERPIEHTVKQFACDSLAGIVLGFGDASKFSDHHTKAGHEYITDSGIRIRAGWKLLKLKTVRQKGKRPRVIELNLEPEDRAFSLFVRMEFSPHLDIAWDGQRSRYTCSPAKFSLQGGSGDMEACHRWLTLWKLYR